jgi:hypothetical protein
MTMSTAVTPGGNYLPGYVAPEGTAPAARAQADTGADAVAQLPASTAAEPLGTSTAASGAPQLAPPSVEVDDILENLQSLLPMFLGKGEALTQEALSELIKNNAKVGDALAKGRIDKIREAASKLASADNKEFWGSVLSIAGKALLAIGAIVATVASAGTLGPVLLPLAIYSIVTSVSGLINDVMKEMGYPNGMGFDLTLGNLVKFIATQCGADEETAKEWMQWTDIVVGVAIGLVSLGAMFKSGAALLKAGESAATAGAAKFGNVATKINAITQMAGGAATMASAVVGMGAAKDRRDAEKARAENKDLQAQVLKGQQMAQIYYEALRDILQRMSDGQERLSEIINRHGQTQMGIQGNMV